MQQPDRRPTRGEVVEGLIAIRDALPYTAFTHRDTLADAANLITDLAAEVEDLRGVAMKHIARAEAANRKARA